VYRSAQVESVRRRGSSCAPGRPRDRGAGLLCSHLAPGRRDCSGLRYHGGAADHPRRGAPPAGWGHELHKDMMTWALTHGSTFCHLTGSWTIIGDPKPRPCCSCSTRLLQPLSRGGERATLRAWQRRLHLVSAAPLSWLRCSANRLEPARPMVATLGRCGCSRVARLCGPSPLGGGQAPLVLVFDVAGVQALVARQRLDGALLVLRV